MFDNRLRAEKDKWLDAPARALSSFLTPNQVTTTAFVFGIICGYFATKRDYTTALVFWALNRIFDGLDGTVARVSNQQSDFGGYYGPSVNRVAWHLGWVVLNFQQYFSADIVTDFAVYSLVPICIAYGAPNDTRWLVLSFLLGTYFVNAASWMYLSAILEKRAQGAKGACKNSWPSHWICLLRQHVINRAIALKFGLKSTASGELTTVTMPPGLIGGFETVIFFSCFLIFPDYVTHLFLLMGALVCITIVQRVVWASNHLDPRSTKKTNWIYDIGFKITNYIVSGPVRHKFSFLCDCVAR